MRAKCHFEDIDKGQRQSIIVDEIPYQVNKKNLLERMAELVHEKKLEGISHIQDESDKSGMRVVIELKRGEVPEVVLNNLYKQTQLQDTFGINMVALIDGQPKLCNLKDLIAIFLEHRREVVTRRTVFELRKARERGHVLEGLAVALANIDEFIATIKASPTPPVAKTALMSKSWDSSMVREMLARVGSDTAGGRDAYRPEGLSPNFGLQADGLYRLSDDQAAEILQMRLQRLTGLEQDKILGEYREVMAQIADLLGILATPARVTTIIGDELAALKHEFGQTKLGAAAQPDRAQRARPRHRGPDHADRHGRDALAHRLRQEPGALRVPGAAARRARQAGDAEQGRRLGRAALHRQHPRLHPLLHDARPRLLAQGVGSAAGLARLARPADRQHVPAPAGREGQRRAAADRRLSQLPGRPLRVHGDGAGRRQEDQPRRVQQPAQGRHHRRRPRRRRLPDRRRAHRRQARRHAVLRRRQGGALRRERRPRDGPQRARRARHGARHDAERDRHAGRRRTSRKAC